MVRAPAQDPLSITVRRMRREKAVLAAAADGAAGVLMPGALA